MNCRVCDSARLELAIDLGNQPWCNHFLKPEEVGKEPFYPLRVVFCHDCATPQLDFTVPKEVMFGNHTYLSGVTKSLSDHFRNVAIEAHDRFLKGVPDRTVLDIGSNDGTQLKHYLELGCDVLGIEPSQTTAAIAQKAGVPTLQKFFNLEVARELNRKFRIINAAGVFFHLEELHSATDGIRMLLHDDGVFVIQFLYMKRIVENHAFDQIYHEHLLYYNLANIEALLNRHGLGIFDAYLSPIHGGSMMAFVSHKGERPASDRLKQLRAEEESAGSNKFETYVQFARDIEQMKIENLRYLEEAARRKKRVYGLGAPVKGNTLLNYFKVGPNLVEALIERNALRRGMFSPGMHIPILIEDEVKSDPDIYYVLAWNFKKEILARYKDLIDRGIEFYFPVNPKDS